MKKLRLITVDATGTIFKFKEPPPLVYARIAQSHDIECNPTDLMTNSKKAYKQTDNKWPHFGATSSVSSDQWWQEVVLRTFTEHKSQHIVPVAQKLYDYYASMEPYHVFPDFGHFAQNCQKNGLKMAVLSNFDMRLAGVLSQLGLKDYFEEIITSEEAKASKPDPEIFQYALHKCGIDAKPNQLLHIGDDHRKDYLGAKNLDWHSLLIDRQKNVCEGHVCNSFSQVSLNRFS